MAARSGPPSKPPKQCYRCKIGEGSGPNECSYEAVFTRGGDVYEGKCVVCNHTERDHFNHTNGSKYCYYGRMGCCNCYWGRNDERHYFNQSACAGCKNRREKWQGAMTQMEFDSPAFQAAARKRETQAVLRLVPPG